MSLPNDIYCGLLNGLNLSEEDSISINYDVKHVGRKQKNSAERFYELIEALEKENIGEHNLEQLTILKHLSEQQVEEIQNMIGNRANNNTGPNPGQTVEGNGNR